MPRERYPGAPIRLDLKKGKDQLIFLDDYAALYPAEKLDGYTNLICVPTDHIYDLVNPTMFGLLEDLVPGTEIMNQFIEDFERLGALDSKSEAFIKYGEWIFYPKSGDLVHTAGEIWHRLALVARNSTLITDSSGKLSWQEVRKILDNVVVGVAGASVGNNAAHAIVEDLRPKWLKIADQKNYHLTNGNRIRLSYKDLGQNKAIVTASQIHSLDPFMEIAIYTEGIHEKNIDRFIVGNPEEGEPSCGIIIEETDDPEMKILIRERARAHKVPVVMVTDLGSAVQADVRRFDKYENLSLAPCGVGDVELYESRNKWRKDLSDREKFYDFAFKLIGHNYNEVPEFKAIVFQEIPPLFGGIPQLGSTAMAAGGIAGELVARIALGFKLPERMFIHKWNGKLLVQGGIL